MNQPTRVTATPFDDDRPPLPGAEAARMLESGKALMKAGTPFVTAISVQKPRDLNVVVANLEKEAEFAGEKFWYRLPFKDKETGKTTFIEGPTIGLATSCLREWGNNAVTMDTQETPDAFIFTPRYIDLEKGVQLERAFRQRKNQSTGKMNSDRAIDIAFQIGQSKAIRNVIFNAIPKWLVSRITAKAKAVVAAGITPGKLKEYGDGAVKFFDELGVSQAQLEAYVERKRVEWTSESIAELRAAKEALLAKEADVSELFPKEAKEVQAGPIKGDDLGKSIAEELPPTGGEPSAAEKARIAERERMESFAFRCTKCDAFGSDKAEDVQNHVAKEHAGNGPEPVKDPKKKTGGAGKF